MKAGEVLSDLGRPVVFHANLARSLGSIPAALMLAQLIYWSDKGTDGGWVYKLEADWDAELALGPKQVRNARSVLVGIGVVEHARRGLPALPYYRVHLDRLDEWWAASMVDSGPSSPVERAGQGRSKGPDIPIHTEMTTERGRSAPVRPSRVPEDFTVTDAMRRWAASEVPDVVLGAETAKFLDHWRSASGRTATKVDWVAAWRNWVRKAAEFAKRDATGTSYAVPSTVYR